MINLLNVLKLIYSTFLLSSNCLDLNKERKLALNLFTGILFSQLDIYRDLSLYDCLAIYQLSQNHCIVIILYREVPCNSHPCVCVYIYMLIISHTDVNHTDTGNSPQNMQTYMKTVEEEKKRKVYLCKKDR